MSNRQEGDPDPAADRDESTGGAEGTGMGTETGTETETGIGTGSGADDRPDLPAPRPGLSPEKVIRRVLAALADNDDPFEDAGIRTAFNFAAPAYRNRAGGSLAEFRAHLTDPIHRSLVDHRDEKRGRLRTDDGDGTRAEEKVVVTDADGEKSTYEFALEKQSGGKYDGCWMLDGVDLVYVGEAPDHQHMPTVEFDGLEVKCKEGEILRNVLLRASGVSPHNSAAQYANCGGKGLCGTCAVEVAEGEVTDKTAQEKRRLKFPPHNDKDDPRYRLSCQTRVLSDLVVRKHEGLWGQHVEEYAEGTVEEPGGEPIRVSDEEYRGETELPDGDDEEAERASADGEDLDLSDEARELLDETERMLDRARRADDRRNGDED